MARKHRSKQGREREEEHAANQLQKMLVESGKREELREKLKQMLEEGGWKNKMKSEVGSIVDDRGADNITVEDLVQAVGPRGSQLVPDSIRAELLADVRQFLYDQSED